MKRINEYKKLFSVEKEITLTELKSTYKKLVKEWHPDKFQSDDEKAQEAEVKSRQIIDGYHFLVSIAPETIAANLPEYTVLLEESTIQDFKHKGQVLEITFSNGASYEYFGVNAGLFSKFLNSDRQMRFAKRSILTSFTYRKSKKEAVV